MAPLVRYFFILVALSSAGASSAEGWAESKSAISEAIDKRDCARAWNLAWPWAKAGEGEARWGLATGVLSIGLMPPGVGRDAVTRYRHALVMAVHGASCGESAAVDLLVALLPKDMHIPIGQQLLACLTDGKLEPRVCVDTAVSDRLVPSFASYSAELDALAETAPGAEATCDDPPHGHLPQKPD